MSCVRADSAGRRSGGWSSRCWTRRRATSPGSEIVELCRERDPDTTPSTVYRTLDVLEELGYISHSHSARRARGVPCPVTGRARPSAVPSCGTTLEIGMEDAAAIAEPITERYGFEPDMGHMTIVGRARSARQSAQRRVRRCRGD